MQGAGNPPANVLGDSRSASGIPLAVADIQICLIQRQRLDQLGVVTEDGVNLTRSFPVSVEARLDDFQVRAKLQGMAGRHG